MDDWWSEALNSTPGAEGPPSPLMPLRRRRGWRSGIRGWHIAIGGTLLFAAGVILATCLSGGSSSTTAKQTAVSSRAALPEASPPSPAPSVAAGNPAPASPAIPAAGVAPAADRAAPAPGPADQVAAAPAAADSAIAAGQSGLSPGTPGLQYPWKVGRVYECQFRLEATVGGKTPTMFGTVTYEPTLTDPGGPSGDDAGDEATGTAFVVQSSGVLVTCAHCVHGATQIQVVLQKKTYPAKVTAYDPQHDMALLKIEAGSLPCLALQESDQVELSQDVWVVGYPLSDLLGEDVKITRGTIAGVVDRKDRKLFQIDASINPGNSGGPLVDTQGRVVAIASAILVGEAIDRVGFAIPASDALRLLRQQGIQVAPAGGGTALDGPALRRRVSPSVAFLKVRIGPGGVGVAQRRLVRYTGIVNATSPAAPGARPEPPSRPATVQGRLVVDVNGEVDSCEGDASLPFMTNPLGTLGIEKLPGDGRTEWKTIRLVTLREVEDSLDTSRSAANPYGPYGIGPRYGVGPRYGPSPPRYGPGPRYSGPRGLQPSTPAAPKQTRVSLIPAVEETRYRLDEPSGSDTRTIHKEYELVSIEAKNQTPRVEIRGSGTIQWDVKQGMPRKSEFKGTISEGSTNLTVRVPYTLTYEFTEKDASQAFQPSATPPAGRAAGSPESGQPRDPVRKVSPQPPAKTATPKDPVRKVAPRPTPAPGRATPSPPSSGGLDLLEPDEAGS